jgi:heme/copper-type cytochrome/quinol oxidase subunit 2
MSQGPQEPPSGPPPSDAPTQRMPDGQPPDGSGGSRNLWTVLGVGAGVIVVAVVLFLLLRPDDDGENTAATTPTAQTTTEETTTEATTTEETTTEETTTEETTTTTPADQPQRIVVEVENGQPVGGAQDYDIERGTRVVFIVRADVEEEVHIHGYDLSADVAPGRQAKISFDADDAGEFEVELELSAVPIAQLIVS